MVLIMLVLITIIAVASIYLGANIFRSCSLLLLMDLVDLQKRLREIIYYLKLLSAFLAHECLILNAFFIQHIAAQVGSQKNINVVQAIRQMFEETTNPALERLSFYTFQSLLCLCFIMQHLMVFASQVLKCSSRLQRECLLKQI